MNDGVVQEKNESFRVIKKQSFSKQTKKKREINCLNELEKNDLTKRSSDFSQ